MCLKLRKKIPKMANTTMKEKVRSFNGQDFGIVHFYLKNYHMSFSEDDDFLKQPYV